jgi:hypothetical protein
LRKRVREGKRKRKEIGEDIERRGNKGGGGEREKERRRKRGGQEC